jgi:hypothetical protein
VAVQPLAFAQGGKQINREHRRIESLTQRHFAFQKN